MPWSNHCIWAIVNPRSLEISAIFPLFYTFSIHLPHVSYFLSGELFLHVSAKLIWRCQKIWYPIQSIGSWSFSLFKWAFSVGVYTLRQSAVEFDSLGLLGGEAQVWTWSCAEVMVMVHDDWMIWRYPYGLETSMNVNRSIIYIYIYIYNFETILNVNLYNFETILNVNHSMICINSTIGHGWIFPTIEDIILNQTGSIIRISPTMECVVNKPTYNIL